jgi:hypothetical protein
MSLNFALISALSALNVSVCSHIRQECCKT